MNWHQTSKQVCDNKRIQENYLNNNSYPTIYILICCVQEAILCSYKLFSVGDDQGKVEVGG